MIGIRRQSGRPRGWAIVVLVVVAVAVGVLAAIALNRTESPRSAAEAETLPTVSPTTPAATPTPTPTPTVAAVPRDAERFLTVGGDGLWRAVAGACGGAEPLVQRSIDGGDTWADVTPRYRQIAQVASFDPIGRDGAEMVAALGADCAVNSIRSFTAGAYWESDAGSLASSRYLDLRDASVVVSPGGNFAAPCAQARGLRATGDTVALVCDGAAYVRAGATWTKLPAADVAALAVSDADVIVATRGGAGCAGLTLTRYAGGAGAAAPVGCAAAATAAGPVAIAAGRAGVYVWAGDVFELVPAA